eukprot:IDg3847t1
MPKLKENQFEVQKILEKNFTKLAIECHPARQDGRNKERFNLLQSAFYTLFVGALRKAYNEGGLEAAAKVRSSSTGVFAWTTDDNEDNEDENAN